MVCILDNPVSACNSIKVPSVDRPLEQSVLGMRLETKPLKFALYYTNHKLVQERAKLIIK